MPSFSQRGIKVCPKCKTETENKRCPNCGAATKGSGTWTVRFRFVDENYTTKNMRLSGFATKAEANDAYLEYVANHKKYAAKPLPITTYNELRDQYLLHARGNLKESSYTRLIRTTKRFLDPHFEGKSLKLLTQESLIKWQDELTEKGYSFNYRKNIRSALYNMFQYGKLYYIANPLQFVPGFKNKEMKRKMLFWTEEEFIKFYSVIENSRDKTVFAFLYLTGCRKGEALGLQWKDFDPVNRTIEITKTISHDTLDGTYKLTPPKTKNSVRSIVLPSSLTTQLEEYRAQTKAADNDLIFGNGQSPMPFQTLWNHFSAYIKKSGVKRIRLHDLRHSHTSLLVNKGENDLATAYVIAERIGDSVEQVYQTYGHLFPNRQSEVVDKLDIKL